VSEPEGERDEAGATAAALPLDEPPGVRRQVPGLRVARKAELSPEEPMANYVMCVMPDGHGPAQQAAHDRRGVRRAPAREQAAPAGDGGVRQAQVLL
jgi:hypothetical protein